MRGGFENTVLRALRILLSACLRIVLFTGWLTLKESLGRVV